MEPYNVNIMPPRLANRRAKAPTVFLSLHRETRQAILIAAYDEPDRARLFGADGPSQKIAVPSSGCISSTLTLCVHIYLPFD